MIKNFERNLINYLLSSGKYKIYELEREFNGKTVWMLEGSFDKVDELVVFVDGENFSFAKEKLLKYINESYVGNKGIMVSFIALTESQNVYFDDFAIYSDFVISTSIIQVDLQNLSIVQNKGASYSINGVLSYLKNTEGAKREKEKTKLTLTNILIILNIILFIITVFVSANRTGKTVFESIIDIDNYVLLDFGAKYSPLIDSGEYYRLFTSMFLHAGIFHIVMNMYALRLIGGLIERVYGTFKFALIYFSAGIIGAIASYTLSPSSLSVGASGAIFGLLGAAVVFGIKMRNKIGRDFLNSVFQVIIINLVLGFSISGIDNSAHIGGFVGGLISTLAIGIKNK